MKTILTLLILASPAFGVEINGKLIFAFAKVESGMDDNAIGRAGERGAWQMGRAAWEDCNRWRKANNLSTHRHCDAHHPSWGYQYAHLYMAKLHGQLWKATGKEPTAGSLYAAWNCGLTGFKRRDFKINKTPRTTRSAITKLEKILNEKTQF